MQIFRQDSFRGSLRLAESEFGAQIILVATGLLRAHIASLHLLMFSRLSLLHIAFYFGCVGAVWSADIFDDFGFTRKKDATSPVLTTDLTQGEMVKGLKQALGQGVEKAINRLGHKNGFLTNLAVRIPMPEKLRSVEKTLRAMRQDKLADEFIVTMNRAAEKAVPDAAHVFSDALRSISIEDGRSILTGSDDAATEFFRRTSSTNLFDRFLPIVKTATEQTGVIATYKQLVEKATRPESFGGFGKILGAVTNPESLDVDSYVTAKAMDGLFRMVAEEEKKIRQNPLARSTDLLKKVFGSFPR